MKTGQDISVQTDASECIQCAERGKKEFEDKGTVVHISEFTDSVQTAEVDDDVASRAETTESNVDATGTSGGTSNGTENANIAVPYDWPTYEGKGWFSDLHRGLLLRVSSFENRIYRTQC